YKVEYYNLDAVISIGYRVNSIQGTQFRIWATNRLKEYLADGFSISKKRFDELSRVVQIIQNTGYTDTTELSEVKGLLDVLSRYTKSFALLNQFDSRQIQLNQLEENIIYEIRYAEAIPAIQTLQKQLILAKEASSLFGNQKDESFKGILKSITQTFDGKQLYPTIEEQAAHLLYFTIKTHRLQMAINVSVHSCSYGFSIKTGTC
ncbi:MAG TPA: RhuM family protein, partial [Ferruginibacter sp.]|nr:RhuM family protein [Ferruginibacter sp.]